MTTAAPRAINASPTKEFFVEMLTKDVSLSLAILDLVDNSVDGALRMRGDQNFSGLEVDLSVTATQFAISDNCGGISLQIAQDYAFRFGRPPEAESVPHSVGRFGVGLKRAVFKLGRRFRISSTSERSRFDVDVNVPEWASHDRWEFDFARLEEFDEDTLEERRSTTVTVTDLFAEVGAQFSLSYFETRLHSLIAARHQEHLERGIVIRLNGRSILSAPVRFLRSGSLTPAFVVEEYEGVTVRTIVGVGESDPPRDAGWYIYCNGRMVVQTDQSELTGWGDVGIERIPKFHNQFARFRWCIYFDSRDTTKLPWNTTTAGVDSESPVFVTSRRQMITLMRPVINFLNVLDSELDSKAEGVRPLDSIVTGAQSSRVASLSSASSFTYLRPRVPPKPPETVRVQYDRHISAVNAVKRSLRVRTAKAVGERTFDYYVEQEELDVDTEL